MPQRTRRQVNQRRRLFGKSRWRGEKRFLKGKIRKMKKGDTWAFFQMSSCMNEELEENGRGCKRSKREKDGKGERHKGRS